MCSIRHQVKDKLLLLREKGMIGIHLDVAHPITEDNREEFLLELDAVLGLSIDGKGRELNFNDSRRKIEYVPNLIDAIGD